MLPKRNPLGYLASCFFHKFRSVERMKEGEGGLLKGPHKSGAGCSVDSFSPFWRTKEKSRRGDGVP